MKKPNQDASLVPREAQGGALMSASLREAIKDPAN
jgi:hypothetical protein